MIETVGPKREFELLWKSMAEIGIMIEPRDLNRELQ